MSSMVAQILQRIISMQMQTTMMDVIMMKMMMESWILMKYLFVRLTATNYNSETADDDGSCEYPQTISAKIRLQRAMLEAI